LLNEITMSSTANKNRNSWEICKSVWYALTLREVQTMFWSRRFGVFWLLAEPILYISVTIYIRQYLLARQATNIPFGLWLVMGLVPFLMMRSITTGLMGAVTANKPLFTYRQVKPFDTYIVRAIIQLTVYTIVMLLMVFGMVFFLGYQLPIYKPVEILEILFTMFIFSFSFGMILSPLVHTIIGIAPVIRLMFLPLMIFSGVIFQVRKIPQPYYDWLLWNPYLHLIDLFRQNTIENYKPLTGVSLEYIAKLTIIMLFIAMFIYRRMKNELAAS